MGGQTGDAYLDQIFDALGEVTDRERFESCAIDLFRSEYPGLASLPGGADSGRDGILPSFNDEQNFAVITTQKDVKENLKKSLKSNKKKFGKPGNVVVITNQDLRPKQVDELKVEAEKLGYRVINIHQKRDVAYRLSESPKWAKSLLGLAADPPALSKLPSGKKPLIDLTLVGREQEIKWLKATQSDKILVGQPGAGKTSVLSKLTNDQPGFFVKSSDLKRIAEELRSRKPSTLILDDAHTKLDLLRGLIDLREENQSDFGITASCWPDHEAELNRILRIPPTQIKELEQLSANHIVKIINNCGIETPNWLVSEILKQAEGRPGLAATLASAVISGGVEGLRSADALLMYLREIIKPNTPLETLLGAFSLGGKNGMPVERVAKFSGVPIIEINQLLSQVAGVGIVTERPSNRISVSPAALRQALIRNVFFKGYAKQDIAIYIGVSPDLEATTYELIQAKFRGAEVADTYLRDLVSQVNSDRIWSDYAALGKAESRWILENHLEKIEFCVEELLYWAPEEAVPALLDRSVPDAAGTHSEKLIDTIEGWVKSGDPRRGIDLKHRTKLFSPALDWLSKGGNSRIGIKAICIALSPIYQETQVQPGVGDTVVFTSGYVSEKVIEFAEQSWPLAKELLCRHVENAPKDILELIQRWALRYQTNGRPSQRTEKRMINLAKEMVADLEKCSQHLGLLLELNRIKEELGQRSQFVSKDFELLYKRPPRRSGWTKEWEAQTYDKITDLADQWATEPSDEVVPAFSKMLQQASDVGLNVYHADLAAISLGKKIQKPTEWLEACQRTTFLPFRLIATLIERILHEDHAFWEHWAIKHIDSDEYQNLVIGTALTDENISDGLLDMVIGKLTEKPWLVDKLGIKRYPSRINRKLLSNQNESVRINAALNECGFGDETVRTELLALFEEVLLDSSSDEYPFEKILQSNSSLAFNWLKNVLSNRNIMYHRINRSFASAISGIDLKQKLELLKSIEPTYSAHDYVRIIVGDNTELYAAALATESLNNFRLDPLRQEPTEKWIGLAEVASDFGISPEQIALQVLYPTSGVYSGPESVMWTERMSLFDKLAKNPNSRISEIGTKLIEFATARKLDAEKIEKHREIYGFEAQE